MWLNILFLQDFDNVSVEYVTLPGWKASIADCRSFAALPERARKYVEEVERLLGVPGELYCPYITCHISDCDCNEMQ